MDLIEPEMAYKVGDDYIDLRGQSEWYFSTPDMPDQLQGAFLPEDAKTFLVELIDEMGFDNLISYLGTASDTPKTIRHQMADNIFSMTGETVWEFDPIEVLTDLGYQHFTR